MWYFAGIVSIRSGNGIDGVWCSQPVRDLQSVAMPTAAACTSLTHTTTLSWTHGPNWTETQVSFLPKDTMTFKFKLIGLSYVITIIVIWQHAEPFCVEKFTLNFVCFRYLQEAVMTLDTSHPVTREHMPTVLGGLVQKLHSFVQTYPHDKMSKNLRMLLMAAQSLLR